MSDDVRLVIAGRELAGFTGATISMDIDQIADAFSVTVPFDPERPELRQLFRPFGYQAVKLYIGEDLLITGRVDKIEPKLDAGERAITLQGRSLPGPLADCSIDGALEFSGMALSAIARRICQPFGITVRADNDTNPLEVARAEFGQKAADFLGSLATPRNLFLNSSSDGKLVISWGRSLASRDPVAALVEGRTPLKAVTVAFDGTKRFSKYVLAAQFAGEEDIRGTVTDSGVPVYRPQLSAAGDIDADTSIIAAKARAASFAAAISISATVEGWKRPDGQRWTERQMITLKAPGAMLYIERKYLVAGVSLKLDATEGRTAELRLVFPETYAGKMPEVLPWA